MIDWRGVTAVILALGVSVAIIGALVGAIITTHIITEQESALISGVIGAAVGAVATYLGGGRAAERTVERHNPPVTDEAEETGPQEAA